VNFYSSTTAKSSLYISPLYITSPAFAQFVPASTKCVVDGKGYLGCAVAGVSGAQGFWVSRGRLWLGATGVDPDTKLLGTAVKVKVVY
jgi:hypothetical protein